jgi:hypothetical protein
MSGDGDQAGNAGGRHDAIWLAGLVVFAWLRLLPCFVEGRFPLFDDARAQHYPWYSALFTEIRAGRWPDWSPEIFLGYPLAASVETHLFSPLNVAFLLFPPAAAIWIRFGLACSLGCAGAFLLARHFGASRGGALAGGVLWGLGNHAWFVVTEPYSLATYAWFPLAWLCWDRVLTAARPMAWAIACGLTMGAALLGGNMQHVYGFGLFLAGFSVVRMAGRGSAPTHGAASATVWTRAYAAATGVAIALGVFAVSLWPSLDLSAESVRAHIEPWHRLQIGFDIHDAPLLLFPDLKLNTSDPEGLQYAPLGWSTLALALFACGRGRRLENGLAAVAAAFFLLAMGGRFPPAGFLIRHLPGFSFRDPHRFFLLCTLAMAVLVARGTEALSRAGDDRPTNRALALRALVFAGVAALALVVWGVPGAESLPNIAGAVLPVALALAWRAWPHGHPRRWDGVCTALVIVGLLLSTSGRSAWIRRENARGIGEAPPEYLSTLPRADAHGPVRVVILSGLAGLGSNDTLLTGHHAPGGYASLTPYRLSRLFSVGRALDPFSYERRDDFDFVARPALLDLLNVRFLVASDSDVMARLTSAAGHAAPSIEGHAGYVVAERATYLPRAFFISDAVHVEGEDAAYRAITDDSFDPRDHVVIENGGPTGRREAPATSATRYVPATVTSYAAREVSVAVDAPASGWLVLLDAFAPGWSCRVNGTVAAIERANYLFRAVRIGPGPTHAVFVYSNSSLRKGAIVTAATLLLAFLGLAYQLRAVRNARVRHEAS